MAEPLHDGSGCVAGIRVGRILAFALDAVVVAVLVFVGVLLLVPVSFFYLAFILFAHCLLCLLLPLLTGLLLHLLNIFPCLIPNFFEQLFVFFQTLQRLVLFLL